MKRVAVRRGKPSQSQPWLLWLLLLVAAGAVLGIAAFARQRAERRAAEVARTAEVVTAPALEAGPSEESQGGEARDPLLDKVLAAAEPPNASVPALDAAAHALLVRDAFPEAEEFVRRALAASPHDAEATIHRVVLRGVAGDTVTARSELERLARGPAGWEASLFSAGFALRDGDGAAALRALRRFRAEAPPEEVSPELEAEIRQLETQFESNVDGKIKRLNK